MNIQIRDEQNTDIQAISDLTTAAFNDEEYSSHTEQFIVNALRAAKQLTVSLVAETQGKIVGHIAFSPVSISDGATDWYGLGPISVLPEYQANGIGSQLIKEGLNRIKALNAKGCVLLGDPNYYGKFSFKADARLILEDVPADYFQILAFTDHIPSGYVTYSEAFNATA
ncbi:GNAT family N-acetyltransferase [Acinetobacter sp. YQ_14]|uniref:GNAT family N-acetyltransferase n=1 Tax=Acinetobacter sp. YQ_14 TaxID=3367236 RepID=UPI00370A95B8